LANTAMLGVYVLSAAGSTIAARRRMSFEVSSPA
jgi:hypothetical protein